MKYFTDNIGGLIRKCDMTRSEYRKTLAAVESGDMIRIRRGVFARPEILLSSEVDIESIIPGGILCLYSAWSYHRLTTQIPEAFFVAVKSKRRIVLPHYPEVRLVYVSDSIIDIGVMPINTDGTTSLIYDIERSVCDAIKYRNKVGLDVMSEILTNYLSREDRKIKKLMEYAEKLRIRTILNKYLESRP